jgi:hypothetical protein
LIEGEDDESVQDAPVHSGCRARAPNCRRREA